MARRILTNDYLLVCLWLTDNDETILLMLMMRSIIEEGEVPFYE